MPSAQRNGGKIAYIDLYAGPGRYKDGAASTPLLVLQTAINHPQMAQMLVSYFNDVEINNTSGVRLTEESDVGFPHPVAHASLAHAYRKVPRHRHLSQLERNVGQPSSFAQAPRVSPAES